MSASSPEALQFLLSRRSRPAKLLHAPYPDVACVHTILTAATRTPDHGKLEPWRFIVLEGKALTRLADLAVARGQQQDLEPDQIEKARVAFANAGLVIAVVAAPVASVKIPEMEQILSAGAVCLATLNAALADGWGANWLTGWVSRDRAFLAEGLKLEETEFVAGFIHLGTCSQTPPDRPRPDLDRITTWMRT